MDEVISKVRLNKEFLQKLRIIEEVARKGITESVVRQMRELDNQELKRQEEELK